MHRIRPTLVLFVLALALAPFASAQLSGVVEIQMRTENGQTYFDPAGVWVEPGTTIRFVNVEGVHDSRAYHPTNGVELLRIPEGAEPWDSGLLGGLLDPDGVFEVTLTEEGVYDYFCMPHHALGMVGRIVVGDPDAAPARDVAEIPFEAAQRALPDVERILEATVVTHDDMLAAQADAPDASGAAPDAADDAPDAADAPADAPIDGDVLVIDDAFGWAGGGEPFTTEPFSIDGPWELTLAAWCFDGISFVDAIVFGEDGEQVTELRVIGQGVRSTQIMTDPGVYYIEVRGPDLHVYTFELAVSAGTE